MNIMTKLMSVILLSLPLIGVGGFFYQKASGSSWREAFFKCYVVLQNVPGKPCNTLSDPKLSPGDPKSKSRDPSAPACTQSMSELLQNRSVKVLYLPELLFQSKLLHQMRRL